MDELIQKLKEVTATTFHLYIKTQMFHWNVTGMDFPQLHRMFRKQYEEMQGSIDVLAEDIRQMGAYAPSSLERFVALSRIDDASGIPEAKKMVQILHKDNKIMIDLLNECMELAEREYEQGLMDDLAGRLKAHKKNAWMLRATAK